MQGGIVDVSKKLMMKEGGILEESSLGTGDSDIMYSCGREE